MHAPPALFLASYEVSQSPVSLWTDTTRWHALLSREGCPVCRDGAPSDVIAELDAAWVTMPEAAPMRGYACLVSRIHAIELHDLTDEQTAAFFGAACRGPSPG